MKTERDTLWLDGFEAGVKSQQNTTLTQVDAEILSEVQDELGNINQTLWSSIDDDLFFPKDKVHKDGEQIVIGRCVGTVPTSPERLLGWMVNIDSDIDNAKHIKANGPNAEQYPNVLVAKINDHHIIQYSCRNLPFSLVARDWLSRGVFSQMSDDKFVLVFKFIDEEATAKDVPPYTQSTLKLDERRVRGQAT